MKRTFALLILSLGIFFVLLQDAYTQTRLYYENFDDQTINQPSVGNITVEKGFWPSVTSSDYNMNAVGRGGTGYCFSGAQDVSAYLVWWYSQTWPTDEIYFSFYQRFDNLPSGQGMINIKQAYPHFGGNGDLHVSLYDDHSIISNMHNNGSRVGSMISTQIPDVADGNWH